MPDFSSSPSFSLYLYVYAECLLNEEEYAWGRRRVHRRRNYAVVILTVDTTLNMYAALETRESETVQKQEPQLMSWCHFKAIPVQDTAEPFKSSHNTIFYLKKRKIREINISWSADFT